MIKNFHIGIKALIIYNDNALVLKELDIRDKKTQLYDLPGGRMEEGEEIEDTLKRELNEELGDLNYSLGPIVHAQIHPYYDKNGSSLMLLFYKVDIKIPKIKLSDEHIKFEWISKKDLNNIIEGKGKMHAAIKRALEKVLK